MKRADRPDKSTIIGEVCAAISASDVDAAKAILHRDYKFEPEPVVKRRYGPLESTQVFVRDGFLDRYTGTRVIFPPVFRILSLLLPSDFPYHPAWKTDLTHPAYWELGATIDHLVPVTRGGGDDASNWITASMASNSAKMTWTLEELGWSLHPPGDISEWDGLTRWFLQYATQHSDVLTGRIREWYRAGKSVLPAIQRIGELPQRPWRAPPLQHWSASTAWRTSLLPLPEPAPSLQVMAVPDYRERIVLNPEIRFGKPVVRGTRITVGDVLGYLAGGMSEEAILAEFPQLTREDIRACLAFAADREHRSASVSAT